MVTLVDKAMSKKARKVIIFIVFFFLRVCQNYDKKNQKEETTGMRGVTRVEIRKILASLEQVKTQNEIQDMKRVADTNGNIF